MKARLLKNLRKDAEYAITIEYAYPMYVVTLNMAGFTTNGIIKYPTNRHIIGAKPTPFPINPFFDINCSFVAFLFS